ncbi:hypothetical protein DsansV1_C06g0062771 [Dioscorea sansibarensis]
MGFLNDFRWNEGHTAVKSTDFWVGLDLLAMCCSLLVNVGAMPFLSDGNWTVTVRHIVVVVFTNLCLSSLDDLVSTSN